MDNIVKIVWFVSSRDYLEEFRSARDEWFSRNAPRLIDEKSFAATLLIVGLDRAEMMVEIDVVATLP